MHYRDTLWVALSAALGMDAGEWIKQQREGGATWRTIESACARVGVPVSHEYLRTQAKARGINTYTGQGAA
jgi:hypothetical protein